MAKEAIHMERNNVAQIVKQLTWSAVFVIFKKLFFFSYLHIKNDNQSLLQNSKKKHLLTICREQFRFAFQRNSQIYWLTT